MKGDRRRRQPQRVRAVDRHGVVHRRRKLTARLFLDGNGPARARSSLRRVLRPRYCRSQRRQRRSGGQQPRDPWIHGQLLRSVLSSPPRDDSWAEDIARASRSDRRFSVAATPTYSSIGCAVPKDQLRGRRKSAWVRQTGLFRLDRTPAPTEPWRRILACRFDLRATATRRGPRRSAGTAPGRCPSPAAWS